MNNEYKYTFLTYPKRSDWPHI